MHYKPPVSQDYKMKKKKSPFGVHITVLKSGPDKEEKEEQNRKFLAIPECLSLKPSRFICSSHLLHLSLLFTPSHPGVLFSIFA